MELKLFAKRFKELREEKGLTQSELLKIFNESFNHSFGKSSISMYENGKRIPEIVALADFADFFDVSIDYLLGKSDIKKYYNDNTDFIKLLKKVIGHRSLSDFCRLISIEESRLEQILKGNLKNVINPDMLKRISSVSDEVTYDELLRASGLKAIDSPSENTTKDIKEADRFTFELLQLLKKEGFIDSIYSVSTDKAILISDMIQSYLIDTNNNKKYEKE